MEIWYFKGENSFIYDIQKLEKTELNIEKIEMDPVLEINELNIEEKSSVMKGIDMNIMSKATSPTKV